MTTRTNRIRRCCSRSDVNVRQRLCSLGLVPAIAVLGSTSPAAAALSNPQEPSFHASFVRDSTGAIVATDATYGADLKAVQGNYSAIIVVMQQCFGGGFHDDIGGALLKNYSVASASHWSELAWNSDDFDRAEVLGRPIVPPIVDNFTRPWRDNAALAVPPAANRGVLDNFNAAIAGSVALNIGKDPFADIVANVGWGMIEHPQYQSGGAADDARTLAGVAAVLVAWDTPSQRHAVDIQRVYTTLTTVYGIPAGQIAVLYPGLANLAAVQVVPPPNPTRANPVENLPAVPTSGGNTRNDWTQSLGGGFFPPGVADAGPDAQPPLFVFNTGHGAHAIRLPFGFLVEINVASNGRWAGYRSPWQTMAVWAFSRLFGFDPQGSAATIVAPGGSDAGVFAPGESTDIDSFDNVQLTFSQPLDPSLSVGINGTFIGQGLPVASSPLPLGSFVSASPTFSYAFRVPHALFAGNTVFVMVSSNSSSVPVPPQSALLAVDLRGGEQEFLFAAPSSPPPPPSCTDGVLDGDETDVDCGGSCTPCPTGGSCEVPSDCTAPNTCTSGLACFPVTGGPAMPPAGFALLAAALLGLGTAVSRRFARRIGRN
jgi:hypothetical protein